MKLTDSLKNKLSFKNTIAAAIFAVIPPSLANAENYSVKKDSLVDSTEMSMNTIKDSVMTQVENDSIYYIKSPENLSDEELYKKMDSLVVEIVKMFELEKKMINKRTDLEKMATPGFLIDVFKETPIEATTLLIDAFLLISLLYFLIRSKKVSSDSREEGYLFISTLLFFGSLTVLLSTSYGDEAGILDKRELRVQKIEKTVRRTNKELYVSPNYSEVMAELVSTGNAHVSDDKYNQKNIIETLEGVPFDYSNLSEFNNSVKKIDHLIENADKKYIDNLKKSFDNLKQKTDTLFVNLHKIEKIDSNKDKQVIQKEWEQYYHSDIENLANLQISKTGNVSFKYTENPSNITTTLLNFLKEKFELSNEEIFNLIDKLDLNNDGVINREDDYDLDGKIDERDLELVKKFKGSLGSHDEIKEEFLYKQKISRDLTKKSEKHQDFPAKPVQKSMTVKKIDEKKLIDSTELKKSRENIVEKETIKNSEKSEPLDWTLLLEILGGLGLAGGLVLGTAKITRKRLKREMDELKIEYEKKLKELENTIIKKEKEIKKLKEDALELEEKIKKLKEHKQELKDEINSLNEKINVLEDKAGITKLKNNLQKEYDNLKKSLEESYKDLKNSIKKSSAKSITEVLESLEREKSVLTNILKDFKMLGDKEESIPIVFDTADIKKTERQIMEIIDSFELTDDGNLLVTNPIFVFAEKIYTSFEKQYQQNNFILAFRLVSSAKSAFDAAKIFEQYVLQNIGGERNTEEDLTDYQREVANELRQRQKGEWLNDSDYLKNFYEMLEIKELEENQAIIKRAYRDMAKRYHPDKSKEEEKVANEAIFIEIQLAYEVLSGEDSELYIKMFKKFNNIS